MHHQGHETTDVGDDHFRSTGVKLWATVPEDTRPQKLELKTMSGGGGRPAVISEASRAAYQSNL